MRSLRPIVNSPPEERSGPAAPLGFRVVCITASVLLLVAGLAKMGTGSGARWVALIGVALALLLRAVSRILRLSDA